MIVQAVFRMQSALQECLEGWNRAAQTVPVPRWSSERGKSHRHYLQASQGFSKETLRDRNNSGQGETGANARLISGYNQGMDSRAHDSNAKIADSALQPEFDERLTTFLLIPVGPMTAPAI
ncbi:MAG: hypothetical protein B6D68_04065 [spirochete symbiont of Stewartia floridana]|nr:MAG: hypothetical protein B6D68_04065 [spirochete symbiont of Stewartia floridana]